MDRYFQICRCFRDEDFRADRQLEFTQLDLEMSFPRQQDIFDVIERVMERACAVAGVEAKGPFRHLDYKEAMRRYGSDKPDLRFGMELHNVTEFFEPARAVLHFEGNVQAVVAPGAASWSRKQLDELAEFAKGARRARRLHGEGDRRGRFVAARKKSGRGWAEETGGSSRREAGRPDRRRGGERADSRTPILRCTIAGQIRLHLGDRLNLIDRTKWEFAWITGFALFEWSEREKRWVSAQHPFTGIVRGGHRKARDRSVGVPLEGLRPGAERRRAWLGQHSNSSAGRAGARCSRRLG